MVGIMSFGAYVPFHRLNRDEIARAWAARSSGGHKAVASYDEDSVTMAVAAARDCLKGLGEPRLDGLFLATTTPPYREKQSATIVASALDCRQEARTVDITDSLRAGTIAIDLALDAIRSGRSRNILVTAADCRLGAPNGELESLIGDGAAALLLGDSEVVASIEGSYSVANELLDVWRADKDTYLRSWEDRFIITQGYNKIVGEAVTGLLKKYGLTPADFTKVILAAPDMRSHVALAKNLGFDAKTQLQESLISVIGHTGTPAPLVMLVAALERAKPGDRLLLASYGDGSDAFLLQITENITRLQDGRGVYQYVQSKALPINYEKYLRWREQIAVEPPRLLEPIVPSPVALYRERKRLLALYGQKCRQCGNVQYPPKRLCVQCRAKDQFDDYKFADRRATVVSFAKDYATAWVEPPRILCVLDFEGGGRMQTELTDRDPDEIKVGLPVVMTFRKLQDLKGIHHYFWKCKPER